MGTPSSPDPVYSHMTQDSSQTGLGEPGVLSKHLQDDAYASNLGLTRMFTPAMRLLSWQRREQEILRNLGLQFIFFRESNT